MNENKTVSRNITAYLKFEGLKIEYLAKRMNLSEDDFFNHIKGEIGDIIDFAKELSLTLGRNEDFFTTQDFDSIFSYLKVESLLSGYPIELVDIKAENKEEVTDILDKLDDLNKEKSSIEKEISNLHEKLHTLV